ncbi:hypothetical protein AB0E77_31480 [Streptomyces sp. NPDC032940]|uniref:hypothetical protein n=1 Tax=Streptomyces sp. NPDC032940 TaxID=3155366 RepID=UPI0033EA44EF
MRAQGHYGPELRDVLPAIAGLGLTVAGVAVALAWLYRAHGAGSAVAGVALLAAVTLLVTRWRRAAVRRRGGIYTPAELMTLDELGLAVAAERMLRRDGWDVISMPDAGRPRLYARDRGGRRLDVGFRPADGRRTDDAPPAAAPTLRETHPPGLDDLVRVVVSQGAYSRTDELWAARQGRVHLVDGRRLRQWAAGASLDALGLPG